MFIHMQRLYQIGLNIKLCICQFTLPADLDISVERVFNIVYILVKFVMIIIFFFLHNSIMLCESEVLTYQGIVEQPASEHAGADHKRNETFKFCLILFIEKINDNIVIAILYHCW